MASFAFPSAARANHWIAVRSGSQADLREISQAREFPAPPRLAVSTIRCRRCLRYRPLRTRGTRPSVARHEALAWSRPAVPAPPAGITIAGGAIRSTRAGARVLPLAPPADQMKVAWGPACAEPLPDGL